MASRLDISNITPLGAYAAKRCPVRIQLDILQPSEAAPIPVFNEYSLRPGLHSKPRCSTSTPPPTKPASGVSSEPAIGPTGNVQPLRRWSRGFL